MSKCEHCGYDGEHLEEQLRSDMERFESVAKDLRFERDEYKLYEKKYHNTLFWFIATVVVAIILVGTFGNI